MIDNLSSDLSKYRFVKAKDLLSQAILLHNNQKYDGSINRSYYAIFNGIRSLLALIKLDSPKHSGIISYFDRYFVKTKIFNKKYSEIIHYAFDIRQDNDYEDFYTPSKDESARQIKECEEFLQEIEKIIESIIIGKINLPQIKE